MWYHIPTCPMNESFYASSTVASTRSSQSPSGGKTSYQCVPQSAAPVAETVTHNLLVAKSDFSKRSWYPVVYRTADVELVDLDLRVVGVANAGGKGGAFAFTGSKYTIMKADPTVREIDSLYFGKRTSRAQLSFFIFFSSHHIDTPPHALTAWSP